MQQYHRLPIMLLCLPMLASTTRRLRLCFNCYVYIICTTYIVVLRTEYIIVYCTPYSVLRTGDERQHDPTHAWKVGTGNPLQSSSKLNILKTAFQNHFSASNWLENRHFSEGHPVEFYAIFYSTQYVVETTWKGTKEVLSYPTGAGHPASLDIGRAYGPPYYCSFLLRHYVSDLRIVGSPRYLTQQLTNNLDCVCVFLTPPYWSKLGYP